MDEKKPKTRTIVTPVFRAAFAAVFTPEQKMNTTGEDGLRYTVTMLFPKTTDLTALRDLAREVAAQAWPDPKKRPALKSPFRDGDTVTWDGFAGNWFVKAQSVKRPGVVDQRLQKIIDPERFYSGCFARAEIDAYAYNKAGNAGVGFGLYNLQLVRDGDPFTGARDPATVFEMLPDDGAAARSPDDDRPTEEKDDDIPF